MKTDRPQFEIMMSNMNKWDMWAYKLTDSQEFW